VRTLVGSEADVVVVVGSALEVVIKMVEVAESEASSVVVPEIASVRVWVVAVSVSVSDTAVDSVKKVVDVSVASATVEEEMTGADVASTELVDKATEPEEEEGLHGDAEASWHIASS
jgi:hypothetical protein